MTKSSSGLSEPSQPIKSLPAGNDKTTSELAGITNEEDKIAAAHKYIKDVFDENVEKVKAHAITKAHETMLSI